MDRINRNPVMDCKMMTTILAMEPDGAAVIGVWNGMQTMAGEDPEGCVRLNPGQPMDVRVLAGFFRCTVAVVEKVIEIFGKLQWLTVEGGLIRICSCAGRETEDAAREIKSAAQEDADAAQTDAAPVDAAREHRNELTRLRVRRFREKKKRERMLTAAGRTDTAAGLPAESKNGTGAVTQSVTRPVTDVTDSVTQPVTVVMDEEEKRKKQRKENINNNNLNNPDKPISIYGTREETETVITCLAEKDPAGGFPPFAPGISSRMVSLETLTAPCRSVLEAWNRLPLKKFTGLVPRLLQKLNGLLARYGEATVRRTVEDIGRSSFLLGKKGTGWFITLGWLLEPGNFAKVFSGKYRDRNDEENNYTGWNNGVNGCTGRQPGERFPFYLPGEENEPLNEEQTRQGLYDFFHPTSPALEKAARLLGLVRQENGQYEPEHSRRCGVLPERGLCA